MNEVRSTLGGSSSPQGSGEALANVSVFVDDVHVRFSVFEERQLGAAELLRRGFRSRVSTDVHALRGITLMIGVGESVGLVGPNGSGKSTLLRCVAGVQPIASGRVLTRGQAQLLAVNAALDRQLSGRRNIILGGLAMGMTYQDIDDRMPWVVDFSGLGDAINRPMRTYSSGMRARLSFSIATMHQPPILLIDEALAVGDRRFRSKSLRRIRDLREQASTVMMVTHNLGEIRKTCSRTIWLEDGQIVMDGATSEVLPAYETWASDSFDGDDPDDD